MRNKEEAYTHRLSLINLKKVDNVIDESCEVYIDITTQEFLFIRDMIEDTPTRKQNVILIIEHMETQVEVLDIYFFIDNEKKPHTYVKQHITQLLIQYAQQRRNIHT